MKQFTKKEDELHRDRLINAKQNPTRIEDVLDYNLFQGPCRLTERERKHVMDAMRHWAKLINA